jgi:hypothetical protein
MAAKDIFGTDIYTYYRAELQVRERITGGIPKDAATIKAWLKSRLDLDDRQLIELAEEISAAMTEETGTRPSADALLDALAAESKGNGFLRVNGEMVYEGRCLKAGLKEAANSAFPGTSWPGKPKGLNKEGKEAELIRKGLMRYLAETVFVDEDVIPLGVTEPTHIGVERIKHVLTKEGPRSAINIVDIIDKPLLSCTIKVRHDHIIPEVWGVIWETLEEIGIGADRARGDGKFDLIRWERL